MKAQTWNAFLVSVPCSATIWALSPLITDHSEPWDADGLYYVLALLLTGIAAGILCPKPLWAHYLGALIGQLGFELMVLQIGPLFILGAVFLLPFNLIYVFGAALAGLVRRHPTKPPAESRRAG